MTLNLINQYYGKTNSKSYYEMHEIICKTLTNTRKQNKMEDELF